MRLSVVCLLPVLCFGAPTAGESLEKGRNALGDVQSLKALSLTGARRVSTQTPEGPGTMSRESEMHFLLPDKFLRSETVEMPGGMQGPAIVEALDGATSWREVQNAPAHANIVIRTPGVGPGASGPQEAEARTKMLRTIYLRNMLMYTLSAPAGVDVQFEYAGEAESDDGRAWVINAKGPENFAMRLFIDQKTNMPVMASWRGMQARPMIRTIRMQGPPPEKVPEIDEPKPKEVEFEARLSEHKKVGGLLLPHVMTVTSEGKLTEEYEIKSARANPNLKPEKFRK